MLLSDLKKARLDANLTIEEVSEKLNIRKKYLIALEEGDLDVIPGKVYINGYLKIYAKFLNIDVPNITPVDNKEIAPIKKHQNSKFGTYLVIISLLMLLAVIIMYPLVI